MLTKGQVFFRGFSRGVIESGWRAPRGRRQDPGNDSALPSNSPLAPGGSVKHVGSRMQDVKNTLRASVRLSFDGRVHKTFRGPKAEERFENEVRVLRFLETRDCPFVPRLLEADPAQLRIVTTNCGTRVEHLDDARLQ